MIVGVRRGEVAKEANGSLITHGMSLITHGMSLITHEMSLITHEMSLIPHKRVRSREW